MLTYITVIENIVFEILFKVAGLGNGICG